jgi:2-amino-4-hydroxy-6-hydroxymethyldihydropteridine diphosphokinase
VVLLKSEEQLMHDQMLIKNLNVRTIVEDSEAERPMRRDVLVDIVLIGDSPPVVQLDVVGRAIDDRTLVDRVVRIVEGSRYPNLEGLVREIAAICLEERGVEKAMVRVELPGVLRLSRSVQAKSERTRASLNRVLVSLGSNIDPQFHLEKAVARLATLCRLVNVSTAYETTPVGRLDQAPFINAAVLIETRLEAADLKWKVLRTIEKELDRVRTTDKFAPRTIDLDIALYNDEILELDGGIIPDPDLLKHSHVARPLADIAPMWRHPATGETLAEIADKLGDRGVTPLHRLDLARRFARKDPDPPDQ